MEILNNTPDFKDIDYKDMIFPLQRHVEGEDVFTEFPVFSQYKVFFAKLDPHLRLENVMRYISFCFDKGSPFVKRYNDVIERRFWAAVVAGFPLIQGNENFYPEVEDMIRGKNKTVNNMIIQYILLMGDEDYTTFVAYNEALKSQLGKMLNLDVDGDTTKDVKTIAANVKELRGQISELRKEMFMGAEDKLLTASLYDFMESKSLGLSPEAYAMKKKISQERT